MSILERIIAIFAPHACVGCGTEKDALLCTECARMLRLVPSRCYRCKAVTDNYAVCRECLPRTALRRVLVYTHHQDPAKELVHRMKYERARAGADEMAALLATLLPGMPAGTVLTHVPTATSRMRARGYDHAKLLSQALARRTGLPWRRLLGRMGQAHQVGSNRATRLRQLQHAFRPVQPDAIRGKHVLLVDDVLTTGATVETAARMLKRAGAKSVAAVVFAQA